jgi:hypothetical protein
MEGDNGLVPAPEKTAPSGAVFLYQRRILAMWMFCSP